MSNITNITDKIIDDAKQKAAQMIADAEQKAASDAEEASAQAKCKADKVLEDAKSAAARLKERIVSQNTLEMRDKKLQSKRVMIDKVFAEALKTLNNMAQPEFEKFAARFFEKNPAKEKDFIVLPERFKNIDVKKLSPKLSPYVGERKIAGGFVLISGGVEENLTFSALLDYYRSDLETVISNSLF